MWEIGRLTQSEIQPEVPSSEERSQRGTRNLISFKQGYGMDLSTESIANDVPKALIDLIRL